MRYGQLYFYDFDVIFQFLLCESGICSSCFDLLVTAVFSMSASKVEGLT